MRCPAMSSMIMSFTENPEGWKGSWNDTCIVVPFCQEGERFRNIFTGEVTTVRKPDGDAFFDIFARNFFKYACGIIAEGGDLNG